MIYKIYKRVGETSLQALQRIQQIAKIEDEKITFAGRLDPMASGVLFALSGDDRFLKDELNKLDKRYSLSVLIGVSTDTGDILGILNESNAFKSRFAKSEFEAVLDDFVGEINWRYPCFSSKTYEGKQLIWHSLEGACPEKRPRYRGAIHSIKFKDILLLKKKELRERILDDLSKVRPSNADSKYRDFRIADVRRSWEKFFEKMDDSMSFQIIDLEALVTHSVYMRTLAEKIGERLGTSALALHIERLEFQALRNCVKKPIFDEYFIQHK